MSRTQNFMIFEVTQFRVSEILFHENMELYDLKTSQ